MSFWGQISGFGSTSSIRRATWLQIGRFIREQNLPFSKTYKPHKPKWNLPKLLFSESNPPDEMQKTIQAVVYSALFMGGLYLLFTMLKGMKK